MTRVPRDCRWFGQEAQAAIKTHVAALQRLEHEASDRTRASTAGRSNSCATRRKKTTAIIADPAALKDEEELERCRNATQPIRKICADAGAVLVDVLEKHVANREAGLRQAAIRRRDGGRAKS